MDEAQETAYKLRARNAPLYEVHDFLCHASGETCPDGCDVPANEARADAWDRACEEMR